MGQVLIGELKEKSAKLAIFVLDLGNKKDWLVISEVY